MYLNIGCINALTRTGQSTVPQLSLLLDEVTGATSAYSMTKQLRKESTQAFRLVRSSDLAEVDIGFTSAGLVNQGSVTSFLGASQGTIKTIYDQTGSSNHLVQNVISRQPLYSSDGAIFDGVDDEMVNPTSLYSLAYSLFVKMKYILYKSDQNAGLNNFFNSAEGDNLLFRSYSPTLAQIYAGNYVSLSYPIAEGETFLTSIILDSGNSSAYKNGTLINSTSDPVIPAQGFQVGSRPGSIRYANILLDTVVLYAGNQSTNRSQIESFF